MSSAVEIDHLDEQHRGFAALTRLASLTSRNPVWQFIHRKQSAGEYLVEHVEEGCEACEAIRILEEVLENYRQLAKANART